MQVVEDKPGVARNDGVEPTQLRKPYVRPEIIYELDLETRAGCPLADPLGFDPMDPFNLDPSKHR